LENSEEQLNRFIQRPATVPEQAFARCVLAEMAVRRGDDEAAERRFKQSLELEPDNSYTLAAYCDLLLATKRTNEVLELLPANAVSEALRTRRAIALGRAEDALLETLRSSGHWRELAMLQLEGLQAGFTPETHRSAQRKGRTAAPAVPFGASPNESLARGVPSAGRREAGEAPASTGEAPVLPIPELALDSARRNWENQKEPIDAIVLMKAALQSRQFDAARPAVEWTRKAGLQDCRIEELLRELEPRFAQQ
jgi:hypothetical protein